MILSDMNLDFFHWSSLNSDDVRDTAKAWFIETGNALMALMLFNIIGYCCVNVLKGIFK
jgi:hypothetical protein